MNLSLKLHKRNGVKVARRSPHLPETTVTDLSFSFFWKVARADEVGVELVNARRRLRRELMCQWPVLGSRFVYQILSRWLADSPAFSCSFSYTTARWRGRDTREMYKNLIGKESLDRNKSYNIHSAWTSIAERKPRNTLSSRESETQNMLMFLSRNIRVSSRWWM